MPKNYKIKQWSECRHILLPLIQHTELRNGHAFSTEIDESLINDDSILIVSDDGFVVLLPQLDSLHVHFAYAFQRGAIAARLDDVEELAQMIGLGAITLDTKIEKLIPLLVKHGFVVTGEEKGVISLHKQLGG
jgi:hypothetical protein